MKQMKTLPERLSPPQVPQPIFFRLRRRRRCSDPIVDMTNPKIKLIPDEAAIQVQIKFMKRKSAL